MQQAVDFFDQADIKGLVLDMRLNPGGDLVTATQAASFWLDGSQTVAKLGDYKGQVSEVYIGGHQALPDPYIGSLKRYPLVILVDGGSASASEVVMLALLENGLGQVMGERTYGKTTVQTLYELENKEILRITTMHWYSPEGKAVDDGYLPATQVVDDPKTAVDEALELALEVF